jgi:hypothetical protein
MLPASKWHAMYLSKINTDVVRVLLLSAFLYLYDLTATTKSSVQ